MNRTQRGAWFSLASTLLCIAIIIWIVLRLVVLKTIPQGFERFIPLVVFCVLAGASIIFLRKKQSPHEADSDERDNLIKKRAVLVSFISVWVSLAAVTIIPQFIVGVEGSLPVWLLAFINLGVLLIAMSVYSVAVLVQYRCGAKGEES